MRGGARRPHARRTFCTLSVRPRAPTKRWAFFSSLLGNRTMRLTVTDLLTERLKDALSAAGLPAGGDVFWEIPREERHGDYATNVAMTLARTARQPPRKVAEAIVAHFPAMAAVERLEMAGPGFLNVFLVAAWCATALRDDAAPRATLRRRRGRQGARRYLLEFVSANPTGPARDRQRAGRRRRRRARAHPALAGPRASSASTTSTTRATSSRPSPRRWRSGCARRSGEAAAARERLSRRVPGRPRRASGCAADRDGAARAARPARGRARRRFGAYAVQHWWRGSGRSSTHYGTEFDRWSHEAPTCAPRACPSARSTR